VESPPNDAKEFSQRRFAVAVHDAGRAVVGACLGFEVPKVQMVATESKLGGLTSSGAFAYAERTDFLSIWPAGEMAATDAEKRIARRKAREVVNAQREHIISIANALLAAAAQGRSLTGHELDELLALSARVWTVTPAGLAD
jgi:hypothetical protein